MVRVREAALRWAWLWVLLGLAALSGCSPKIGDKCTVSTDCSVQGDRLCDPTQPGGYCTIFNCEPNKCPDEAVCVAFNESSCSSPALSRRFQRTFCMFVCQSDGDCRAGYACVDTTNDPFRQVVDVNPQSTRVCTVPASGPVPMPGPDPAVCLTPDSGAEPDAGHDAATEADTSPDAPEAEPEPDAPESSVTDDAPDSAE